VSSPKSLASKLITTERLLFLRGPMGGGRMLTASECRELADAYEAALALLYAERDSTHAPDHDR
jgi:hypothetical protein